MTKPLTNGMAEAAARRLALQALITALVLIAGVIALLGRLGPSAYHLIGSGGFADLGGSPSGVLIATNPGPIRPSPTGRQAASGASINSLDPYVGSDPSNPPPSQSSRPATPSPVNAPGALRRSTMTRDFVTAPTDVCDTPETATREGWCVVTQIAGNPVAGRSAAVSVLACRQYDQLPGLLTFPDGPEIRIAVYPTVRGSAADAEHPVFVTTNPDQSAHALAAQAGSCWRWSTSLTLVDATGKAVTPCVQWHAAGQTYATELAKQSPSDTAFYPSPANGKC